MKIEPGLVLAGRYRVERELGRGGMGAVHLARDLWLLRPVAVKTLLSEDPVARRRFMAEAEVTGQLQHPGIVCAHELAEAEGTPFLVLELLAGRSLLDLVKTLQDDEWARSAWPHARSLRVFLKVCAAVAHAHAQGVIHRDLKPGNVMLGPNDEVRVVDWGLARPKAGDDPHAVRSPTRRALAAGGLTQDGSVIGTPAYFPPEQADGAPLDARADVYALGAVLYEMLLLEPPYRGTALQVIAALTKGPPPAPRTIDPSITPALEAIVLRAMARRREDRYLDARALAADVEAWLDGRAPSAHRERAGEALRRVLRRHRLFLTCGAAAACVAAAWLGFAARAVGIQTEAARRAQDAARAAEDRAAVASRALVAKQARLAAAPVAVAAIVSAADIVRELRGPIPPAAAIARHAELAELLGRGDLAGQEAVDEARMHLDLALARLLATREPWEAVRRLDPDDPTPLRPGPEGPLLRALALHRSWRPAEAREVLRSIVDPPHVAAAARALEQVAARAPLESRVAALELAIEADPDNAWLHSLLGEQLALLGRFDDEDPRGARKAFERATLLDPFDPWTFMGWSERLAPFAGVTRHPDLGAAAPTMEPVMLLQRRVFELWRNEGAKLPERPSDQRWESMRATATKLGEMIDTERYPIPGWLPQLMAAEGSLIVGKLAEARSLAARAVAAAPRDQPDPAAVLAEVSLREGQWKEAAERAAEVLALDPEHPRASFVRGEALRRLGRAVEARADLARGARGAMRPEPWLRLAQCLEAIGDPDSLEEGIRAARRALELDPFGESWDPRVPLLPEEPEIPRTLARLHLRRGDEVRALLQFARAFVLSRRRAARAESTERWRDHQDALALGEVHERLGLIREAIGMYHWAIPDPRCREAAERAIARLEKR